MLLPEGVKIKRLGPYGGILDYPNDRNDIHIVAGQCWMPREVRAESPFMPGEVVALNDWMRLQLGVATAIIARTRSFQYYRYQRPVQQVEILGEPCRWFAASHFTRLEGTQH